MKIDSKKIGFTYFLSIIVFALIYWGAFRVFPDNFIVNQELNLTPIRDTYSYLVDDENNKEVDNLSLENLNNIQSEYNKIIKRLRVTNETIREIENGKKVLNEQRTIAIKINSEAMWANAKKYEKDKKKAYEEKVVKKELELNLIKKGISKNAVLIANKKLELAVIKHEQAKNDYEISSYILKNLIIFSEPSLRDNISKLEKELETISNEQMKHQKEQGELRGLMWVNLKNWHNQRSNILGFIDFFYYSIGISTTTTFGDITANTKTIRAVVSIQLLLSIILVGLFFNSTSLKIKNK